MGGGGHTSTTTQIYQPTPPPQPSTAEAIDAWVEALPAVYQAQLDFAPKEAQQQVDLAQQYALPLAEAAKSAQEVLYPETTALQEQLAEQAATGMDSPVSDFQRQQFLDNYRANLGTNAGSPIGAEGTAKGLLQLEEDWRRYYRDLGLSVAGRQPLSQPTQPQYTNQLQQFSPAQGLNYQSNVYSSFANAGRPIPIQNSTSTQNPNYSGFIPSFGFSF